MSGPDDLRDYGLPNPTEVTGVPTWEPAGDDAPPCPNCGGKVCKVEVTVKMPQLRGGEGVSTYLGCPACPFASPAVVVATAAKNGGPDDR